MPDEILRDVGADKDPFRMFGNFSITMRIDGDYDRIVNLTRGDDGQHVVEVVENAADELTDDGRSLKLAPMRLVRCVGLPFLYGRIRLPWLAPAATFAGPCSDSALWLPTDIP